MVNKSSRAPEGTPKGIAALDDGLAFIHQSERTWRKGGDPLYPIDVMYQAYTFLGRKRGKNAAIYQELADRLREVLEASVVR